MLWFGQCASELALGLVWILGWELEGWFARSAFRLGQGVFGLGVDVSGVTRHDGWIAEGEQRVSVCECLGLIFGRGFGLGGTGLM